MLHRGAPPPEKSRRLRRAGVDSCSPSCYPAQDFLRDKIASPNQASEAEWTNIDQNVGDLADQILAQLC